MMQNLHKNANLKHGPCRFPYGLGASMLLLRVIQRTTAIQSSQSTALKFTLIGTREPPVTSLILGLLRSNTKRYVLMHRFIQSRMFLPNIQEKIFWLLRSISSMHYGKHMSLKPDIIKLCNFAQTAVLQYCCLM